MRRKRNSRILFWPSLAATAVILVLLSTSHLRQQLGFDAANGGKLDRTSQLNRSDEATQRIAGKVGPTHDLFDAEKPRTRDARPQDDRTDASLRHVSVDVDTQQMLASAAEQPTPTTLLAPIRGDSEELAGLSEIVRHSPPTRTVSATTASESFPDSSDRTKERISPPVVPPIIVQSESYDDSDALRFRISDDTDQNSLEFEAADSEVNTDTLVTGLAWPRTPALDQSLSKISGIETLQSIPELRSWTDDVRQTLIQLQSYPSISDRRVGATLTRLRTLADEGIAIGERYPSDRRIQQQALRTAHALLRRTVVWNTVWQVTNAPEGQLVAFRVRNPEKIQPAIESLRRRTRTTGDPAGWAKYLLLNEIESAVHDTNGDNRKLLAQRLLSRISWDGLTPSHQAWLNDPSVAQLTARIRPWADSPVDYVSLLGQLERQEADSLDLGGIEVATAVQTLRFSDNPRAAAVASAINDYYRNANLRLAVSKDLLARLLPDIPTRTAPIRQTIIGLPVRGTSVVNSELAIELVPTQGAWNLMLGTIGSIDGRTGSGQWPVRVANRSQSEFHASTPIHIDRHQIATGETVVNVNSQVGLRGMTTEFDGFPVVENLVRAIAMSRYEESAPLARRQSNTIIRREIREQVSEEVESETRRASDQLSTRLLGPLGRMKLDPLVVDLDTTEDRLTARYRLAGDWQLAAFTPRPRALADSLLSMQIHQSMLNNTFEQILASNEPQPIRQMMADVLGMFGVTADKLPEELPEDVKIQFASTRPITVEIEDDMLWLTLRVVRLCDDSGMNLNHFVVRAAYRPRLDGLKAELVREGSIRVSGPRLGIRERFPVRAIFTKVLDDDRPLPLVSDTLASHPAAEGLRVGMLELNDGWMCLSVTR